MESLQINRGHSDMARAVIGSSPRIQGDHEWVWRLALAGRKIGAEK
jgi:hypothetical protein